jgi:PAS domain S-box-containing protein
MTKKPALEKQFHEILGDDFTSDLIQNMAEGLVLVDIDGQIEFANPAFENLSGYPLAELLHQNWTKFVPPELHPVVERAKARRYRGEVDRYEVDLLRQDGQRVPVLVTGQPYTTDGVISGTVGVFTDITPLKQAEEALRQSEDRYKSLFNQSRDGIFIQDQEGLLIDVNERALEMLGFSAEEIVNRPVHALHPLDTQDEVKDFVEGIFREGQNQSFATLHRKDGTTFPAEITASTLEIAGKTCIQSVVRDISERLEAAKALRHRADQLEKLLESARDLTISLDFKEVLTRIGIRAKELFQAYGCSIYLLEPDGRTLTPVVALEPPYNDQIMATPLEVEGSFTGQAVKAKRSLYFNEVAFNETGQLIPGIPEVEDERVIVAPFLVEEKVLGAICINRMGGDFNEGDLTLLETFASYASTALKNARMYRELEREVDERKRAEGETSRRNRELALLNQVIADASSTLEPRAILESICRELSLALGGDKAVAGLLNENLDRLEFMVRFPAAAGHSTDGLGLPIDRHPFVSHMVRAKAPIVVLEARDSPYLLSDLEIISQLNVVSLVGLPLTVRDRVWGILLLGFEERREFSPAEIDLAMSAAAAAAQVVETAWLFNETRRRAEELEALAEVSSAMRKAKSQAAIYPIILNQLLYLLEAEGAAVVIRSSFEGDIRIELAHGRIASLTGASLPTIKGIWSQVISGGEPVVQDSWEEASCFSEAGRLDLDMPVLSVPLIAREKAFGALLVIRYTSFSEKETQLLTAISEMVAAAIHRASLHETTERRLQRLTALRTIDEAISASLDLRITLNVFLRQVTDQLGIDAAAVLLLDPHLRTLVYAAGYGFMSESISHSRLRLGEGQAGRAALERTIVHVPNLDDPQTDFPRSQLVQDEMFVSYYGVPLIAKGQVQGVLDLFHRGPVNPDRDWVDFLETLSTQAAIAIDNAKLFNDLQRSNVELALAYDTTIEGWARALELRDMETEGHSQRVTELTLDLARELGFSEEDLVQVRHGSLLHDIGKMGVPDSILRKPGPLDDEEWAIMHQHPVYAYQLLRPISYLRPALDIPYCHHEKWDGTGYPRGLKGEHIPLAARIFAVVDVWDALCSDRPYRPAWSAARALDYIKSESGTHFDPRVVEAFLKFVE